MMCFSLYASVHESVFQPLEAEAGLRPAACRAAACIFNGQADRRRRILTT